VAEGNDKWIEVSRGQWVGVGVIAATLAFDSGEGNPWLWLPLLAGAGLVVFPLRRSARGWRGRNE
jgi:hypothetical protein